MSAVPADLRAASPWRLAFPAVLLLVAAILLLYRDTASAMVEIWMRSDTFAHAILVPPISLWLIWRQRDRLAALTPRAQPWVLLPMAAIASLWLLADLVVVNAATQFALVGLLVLAVPAVLGLQVAGAILFPLMFLFFSVPFGDFMLPHMMEWTADFTVAALKLSGIPVYREGLQFVIPSGNWSVVEACSGVRYLIASFMVGTLFAYLNYQSTRRRLTFVAVSIAVPILANWLRAYFIVMLGHLSGNKLAVGVDHLIYGWVFFGVVIMIMFVVGARWSEPEPAPGEGATARQIPVSSASAPGANSLMATAVIAAAVIALPHLAQALLARAGASMVEPRLTLPSRLSGGWASGGAPAAAWQPSFVNPSTQAQAAYADADGRPVGVYLAYYRGQGPDRKLVSSQNMLVTSSDRVWHLLDTRLVTIDHAGQPLVVRSAQIQATAHTSGAPRGRLTAWQLYWIDGRWVEGDVRAKLLNAFAQLRGQGDEGAVLVLHAEDDSHEAAAARLRQFTSANLDSLGALLRQTNDAR